MSTKDILFELRTKNGLSQDHFSSRHPTLGVVYLPPGQHAQPSALALCGSDPVGLLLGIQMWTDLCPAGGLWEFQPWRGGHHTGLS